MKLTKDTNFSAIQIRNFQLRDFCIFLCKIGYLLAAIIAVDCHADADSNKTFSNLDLEYQELSFLIAKELENDLKQPPISWRDLTNTIDADEKTHSEKAYIAIMKNMSTIKRNITSAEIPKITNILLKQHATLLANEILKSIQTKGDNYQIARVRIEFAKYYSETGNWSSAIDQLNKIEISTSLSRQQGDEAFIIMGAALQHQKKHRAALEYYEKIKSDSPHYRTAQLNIAVVYIRQDWWTDAHIALKNALKSLPHNHDELANRLYTVMGYSQLQQGFYRDARESFRNVNIKSNYSNRALLGLGMAALHQEDYIGALNAFNHLKNKDEEDASVAESYLMSAFTLDKLGQTKTASASYMEAITYYEQKNLFYENNLKKIDGSRTVERLLTAPLNFEFSRKNIELDGITKKIKISNKWKEYPLPPKEQERVRRLQDKLITLYADTAKRLIIENQTVINSYLSQSRFGLAKHYDTK